MSLINCPECKREISDKAITCPNCGFPVKNIAKQQPKEIIEKKRLSYKRIYFYSVIIAIVLSIIAVVSNYGKTTDSYGLADPTKELVGELILGVPVTAFICSLPTFILLGGIIELYYRLRK